MPPPPMPPPPRPAAVLQPQAQSQPLSGIKRPFVANKPQTIAAPSHAVLTAAHISGHNSGGMRILSGYIVAPEGASFLAAVPLHSVPDALRRNTAPASQSQGSSSASSQATSSGGAVSARNRKLVVESEYRLEPLVPSNKFCFKPKQSEPSATGFTLKQGDLVATVAPKTAATCDGCKHKLVDRSGQGFRTVKASSSASSAHLTPGASPATTAAATNKLPGIFPLSLRLHVAERFLPVTASAPATGSGTATASAAPSTSPVHVVQLRQHLTAHLLHELVERLHKAAGSAAHAGTANDENKELHEAKRQKLDPAIVDRAVHILGRLRSALLDSWLQRALEAEAAGETSMVIRTDELSPSQVYRLSVMLRLLKDERWNPCKFDPLVQRLALSLAFARTADKELAAAAAAVAEAAKSGHPQAASVRLPIHPGFAIDYCSPQTATVGASSSSVALVAALSARAAVTDTHGCKACEVLRPRTDHVLFTGDEWSALTSVLSHLLSGALFKFSLQPHFDATEEKPKQTLQAPTSALKPASAATPKPIGANGGDNADAAMASSDSAGVSAAEARAAAESEAEQQRRDRAAWGLHKDNETWEETAGEGAEASYNWIVSSISLMA
jgi:hypothetical protein